MKFEISGLSGKYFNNFSLSGEGGSFYNVIYKDLLKDRDFAKNLALINKDKEFKFLVDNKNVFDCDLGNSPIMYIGEHQIFSLAWRTSLEEMLTHILCNYGVDSGPYKQKYDKFLIRNLKKTFRDEIFTGEEEYLLNEIISFLKNNKISMLKHKKKKKDVLSLINSAPFNERIHWYTLENNCREDVQFSILISLLCAVILGKKIVILDNIPRYGKYNLARAFFQTYSWITGHKSQFKNIAIINIVENEVFAFDNATRNFSLTKEAGLLNCNIDFERVYNNEINVFYSQNCKNYNNLFFSFPINKKIAICCDKDTDKNDLVRKLGIDEGIVLLPTDYDLFDNKTFSIYENKNLLFTKAYIPKFFESGLLYSKTIFDNLRIFYFYHCMERGHGLTIDIADELIQLYNDDHSFVQKHIDAVSKEYFIAYDKIIESIDSTYRFKLMTNKTIDKAEDKFEESLKLIKPLFSEEDLNKNIIELDEFTRLKVRIAQNIMIGSKLYIFDDICSNFDISTRGKYFNEIQKLILDTGASIMYFTEFFDDILKSFDKVYFIKNNEILKVGKYNKN